MWYHDFIYFCKNGLHFWFKVFKYLWKTKYLLYFIIFILSVFSTCADFSLKLTSTHVATLVLTFAFTIAIALAVAVALIYIYSLAANYNVFRINKQQTWSLHAFCYTSLCLSVSCRVVCVCCMCPSTSSSSSLPLCIMTTCNLAFLFAAACIFLGRLVLPRRLGLLGLIANYG